MSVRIRLTRHGAKKKPFYRIVVTDSHAPRDGKFIEQVGTYDPRAQSGGLRINSQSIETWIQKGALPSQTVSELLKQAASEPTTPASTQPEGGN